MWTVDTAILHLPSKRVAVTFNTLEGGVEGSILSMTESRYMNTHTFDKWFAKHFIPNLLLAILFVLLSDSHDSHLGLEAFQLTQTSQKRDSPRSTC